MFGVPIDGPNAFCDNGPCGEQGNLAGVNITKET